MRYGIIVTLSFVVICAVSAQDIIQVKTGWNLIGSVKAGAVPDVLFSIPDSLITSSYFGYTPGVGYESTDTLETGVGYWVKANSEGLIVFNDDPPHDSCKSKAFVYQGKLYHTVLIGDQCWMAENLDIGVAIDSSVEAVDNGAVEKYCYRDDPANCILYGGLYQWDEAMQYSVTGGAQGICPAGWHLPTLAEWEILSTTLAGDGDAMKVAGIGPGTYVGTNTSGYSALFSGIRDRFQHYSSPGTVAAFWSSTQWAGGAAKFLYLYYSTHGATMEYDYKQNGFSVRCLED